ncbi:MAG: hypothetical protein Ct9H300mP18_12880 [Candidatus Neomarinimicrobiota bacterium]|nr:MAG: hypothetical protein Ct9H300mP18_12880 [Candidatus Neomarinimicrobiota bacterium]
MIQVGGLSSGEGNGNFKPIHGHNSGILVYGDQRGALFQITIWMEKLIFWFHKMG